MKKNKKRLILKTNLPANPNNIDTASLNEILKDIKAIASRKQPADEKETIVLSRRPQSAVIGYGNLYGSSRLVGNAGFNAAIHDLGEIARAIDTESYLARSVQKHREYILKEGWTLVGKTPETLDYVKNRLFHFAMATDITTDEWVRELITNLVTYSTCFLVLKRDQEKSLGFPIRLHGKYLDPIAGLFPMDPVSVKVRQNMSGRAVKWKQEIGGQTRIFDSEDVIDITIDRKSGFAFGTPYSLTVLDDIRALRRLEELCEMVAHKHLFPLFHVKVGTDEKPAQDVELADGSLIPEVDIAKAEIQEMPTEGGLVTSERYTIELLGSEDKVLDLMPYIEHFKERVMSGLRLSPLDLGQADTGNKATAQVVNRNLVDAVKDYQRVFSDCITFKLLDKLVLEGGFDLNQDTRVQFQFPTADKEEERAMQQHGLSLFQSNAITCEEMRQGFLKKECFTPEQESDTWFERFEKPVYEAQLKAKAASATSSGTKKDSIKIKNRTSTATRPQNQYGRMATKPSIPINDFILSIKREWEDLSKNIKDNNKNYILTAFYSKLEIILKKEMVDSYRNGYLKVQSDTSLRPNIAKAQAHVNKTATMILQNVINSNIINYSKSNADGTYDRFVLETAGRNIEMMAEKLIKQAYADGIVSAIEDNNYSDVEITTDNSNINSIVNVGSLNDFLLENLVNNEIISIRNKI